MKNEILAAAVVAVVCVLGYHKEVTSTHKRLDDIKTDIDSVMWKAVTN